MPQAPSTRWCPTPEQLMILEEMYRSGVRSPNASQIQQITAHLSYYGKIEGKNVFYWFQNHKARDRQKLRRRLSRHHQLLQQYPHIHPFNLQGLEEASHTLPQLHHNNSTHFLHQESCQDQASQGLNLLGKLEAGCGNEGMAAAAAGTHGYELTDPMDICSAIPPCCRPLKTLDLFPTKSTGIRDECSTSKSSSSTCTTT